MPSDRPSVYLTPAQRVMLELSATGLTTSEISARYGRSPDLIRSQLLTAIEALGADSKLEAVALALQAGLIERRQ